MFSKLRSSIKGEPSKKKSTKKKTRGSKKSGSSWGDIIFFFILGVLISVAIFYFKFYKPLKNETVASVETSDLRISLLSEWKVELIRRLQDMRRRYGFSDEFEPQAIELGKDDTDLARDIVDRLNSIDMAGIELEPATLEEMALISFKRGLTAEALEIVEKGLKAARDRDSEEETRNYFIKGKILSAMGKSQEALHSFEQSLNIGKNLVSRQMEMKAITALADLALQEPTLKVDNLSGWALAEIKYNKAMTLADELGDNNFKLNTLDKLARYSYLQGDLDKALEKYSIIQKSAESMGDTEKTALSMDRIGKMHIIRESYDNARKVFKELEERPGIPERLKSLGTIGIITTWIRQNDTAKATELIQLVEESESFNENKVLIMWMQYLNSLLLLNQKNYDEADKLLGNIVDKVDFNRFPDLYFGVKIARIDVMYTRSQLLKSVLEELVASLLNLKKKYGLSLSLFQKVQINKRLGEMYIGLLDVDKARKVLTFALEGMEKLGMESQKKSVQTKLIFLPPN